jgi:mRNA interferase MazF
MENLLFGDIVLLKFPFTNTQGFKKRPAVVIKDTNDGDIVLCRITSKIYDSPFDFPLKQWEKYGLRLPSVIRIHKIATLEKSLVELKMGKLEQASQVAVQRILKKLIK